MFVSKFQRRWIVLGAVLVASFGFSQKGVCAQWGSVRANNRSEHQEAPGAPAPAREHPAEVWRGGHRELAGPREHEDARRHAELEHAERNRHLDIDADRRHSYFWYGYHPGMIINALPPAYTQVYVGGIPYYYDQGVYYEASPSGYVVVAPPPGAVVPSLPPGAEAVAAGSTVYYYAGGAFYLPQPQGFLVVNPPLGVTVTELPPNATPVIINGMQYYQAGGAYFLPIMQGGVTVYTTVQP